MEEVVGITNLKVGVVKRYTLTASVEWTTLFGYLDKDEALSRKFFPEKAKKDDKVLFHSRALPLLYSIDKTGIPTPTPTFLASDDKEKNNRPEGKTAGHQTRWCNKFSSSVSTYHQIWILFCILLFLLKG
eukprot:TRINITY_DN457_c0_g4_i8.p1 TRINITY_DN457_c0_g4~~TRINITY_DN457_c0_g4_i8.p1  ORF type:complete len:130 (-),score=15.99 TRINITY_DN457_c0_g4_i8:238-627(-)